MDNNLLQAYLLLKNMSNNSYLVGGCVRDMLMDVQCKDYDLVTDTPMDQIEAEFKQNGWKVDSVGLQFLVLFASKNGFNVEIANFRRDVGFSDGRRPDKAEIGDLWTDAARRDFTINSIYYDPINYTFLDPNNGKKDIENRLLRFIGKPKDRIQEDYLRVFRFFRFLATKDLLPEKNSLKACRELFNEAYSKTNPERVRLEIERMSKYERLG